MPETLELGFLGVVVLGASCGLRVFLAPFVCCLLANLGTVPWTAPWASSPAVLGLAAVLLLAEVVGDKLPGVDQALDAAGLVLRPAWAVGLVLAVSPERPPVGVCVAAAVVALVLGFGKTRLRAEARDAVPGEGRGAVRSLVSLAEDLAASVSVLGAVVWAPVGVIGLATAASMLHVAAFAVQRRRARTWLAGA